MYSSLRIELPAYYAKKQSFEALDHLYVFCTITPFGRT